VTINTKVEWADHTINWWWGCEKVSPGCKNCYAEGFAKRVGNNIWGKGEPRRDIKSAVAEALKLNAKAEKEGVRYRVFSNSMSDFFEEDNGQAIVDHKGNRLCFQAADKNWQHILTDDIARESDGCIPVTLTDIREQAFETIDATPHLDWLLLTKRPENILRMTPQWDYHACNTGDCPHSHSANCVPVDERKYRQNVWLGTSVESQEQADKRIPELLKCRDLSPVLWLSCEPLLGAVDLGKPHSIATNGEFDDTEYDGPSIDWVICGGESGHGARPMHPDWARELQAQCEGSDVPFFFKQWGEWWPQSIGCGIEYDSTRPVLWTCRCGHSVYPITDDSSCACGEDLNIERMIKVGKKEAGRLLNGKEHSEVPDE